jgi:hypothetical protein
VKLPHLAPGMNHLYGVLEAMVHERYAKDLWLSNSGYIVMKDQCCMLNTLWGSECYLYSSSDVDGIFMCTADVQSSHPSSIASCSVKPWVRTINQRPGARNATNEIRERCSTKCCIPRGWEDSHLGHPGRHE